MTDDERIDHLITSPPVVPLSRWDKVERVFGWLTGAIAITALTVAIVVGFSGAQVASCVNANLGARNEPSVADRNALTLLFSSDPDWGILHALSDIGMAGTNVQARYTAFVELTRDFNHYHSTILADDLVRDKNPIGRC